MQQDLAQCKAKLLQLQIKDMAKVLPQSRTSTHKNDVLQLNDIIERYDFDEERERDDARQKLRLLRGEVGRFVKELKAYSPTQEYLNRLEQLSQNYLNGAAEFKGKMAAQFEELIAQEEQLTLDVEGFEQRMDNFDARAVVKKKPQQLQGGAAGGDQSELGQLKQQIEQLEAKMSGLKLLEEEDLREFIRLRNKHKGRVGQQFLNDCYRSMPLLTLDEIMEVVESYNEYLRLEEEKKELIRKYKERKQEMQLEQLQIQEAQKQQEEQQKAEKKKKLVPVEERERQKEELRQWKLKRTATKVIEEVKVEQKTEEEKLKEQKRREEREQRQEQIRMFREQKLLEQQREQELKQMETMARRFVSQEAKERIKMKENHMLEKKRSILESKQQKQITEQMKQQARQEDKYIRFAHVEGKLNEPTKAVELQKRAKFDPKVEQGKYADTFGGNLLGVGRRAQAGWRSNL